VNRENNDGIYEKELNLIPFWYHCDCGSKVGLYFKKNDNNALCGFGRCIGCEKEFEQDLGTIYKPDISGIIEKISARAITMPLVFFSGLGVTCYVGGIGGYDYLKVACLMAEKLNITYPPVAFWRPQDKYSGIGQMQAMMEFKRITGNNDISRLSEDIFRIKSQINLVDEKLHGLKERINEIVRSVNSENKNIFREKIKEISMERTKTKKISNYSVMKRNVKILENVPKALDLIPSIIDYAINIGLSETSRQWINFLLIHGCFSTDVSLKSVLKKDVRNNAKGT
jgi:hypothetical protein